MNEELHDFFEADGPASPHPYRHQVRHLGQKPCPTWSVNMSRTEWSKHVSTKRRYGQNISLSNQSAVRLIHALRQRHRWFRLDWVKCLSWTATPSCLASLCLQVSTVDVKHFCRKNYSTRIFVELPLIEKIKTKPIWLVGWYWHSTPNFIATDRRGLRPLRSAIPAKQKEIPVWWNDIFAWKPQSYCRWKKFCTS